MQGIVCRHGGVNILNNDGLRCGLESSGSGADAGGGVFGMGVLSGGANVVAWPATERLAPSKSPPSP